MTVKQNSRETALQWAATMVDRRDVVYLDTETTGLGSDAEIIEVAAVDGQGRVLIDTLVRPTGPVPLDAVAIHGITDDMLASAPGWPEIYFKLGRLLQEWPNAIIYNAAFDRRIMAQSSLLHGLPPLIAEWHCAMRQYAAYVGEWNPIRGDYRWHRLARVAQQHGLSQPNHRALGDAHACREVVQIMAAAHLASLTTS